jgi:hypothetical protein
MAVMKIIFGNDIAYPGKGITDESPSCLVFLVHSEPDHIPLILCKTADKVFGGPDITILSKV